MLDLTAVGTFWRREWPIAEPARMLPPSSG